MKENEHKYSHSFGCHKLNIVLEHPIATVEHTIYIPKTVIVLHSHSIQKEKTPKKYACHYRQKSSTTNKT